MNSLSFHILLGLKDHPGDAETIVLRMRELGGTTGPPIASFYRALKRTIEAGHVEVAASSEGGKPGRPAQCYRITGAGRSALAVEARRLGRLSQLALSERK
jgi:DNA-binding PadR family transcriptional regulator